MKFEIAPKSTEIQANWYDAVRYCMTLNKDKTGWRLPNKNELNEIYQSPNDFEKDWYWSYTENNGNRAFSQNFFNGYQCGTYKYHGGYNFVRAIRDLKDN